jgi:hypothetical protein
MGDLSDLKGFVVCHTCGCDTGTGCSIPEELPVTTALEAKKIILRS